MERIMANLEENYIKFDTSQIMVILDNVGKLWFGGVNCAEALDYKQPKQAIINHVDTDDKVQLSKINTNLKTGKHPQTIFINEAGLYSLIMSSKQEKAKRFKKWITSEVLPSIREFGYYKFKEKKDKEINNYLKKINYLEKELKKTTNDLKKEMYPNGGLFYVVDYSDENTENDSDDDDDCDDCDEVYRIGIADDMNKRKKIYDTHTLHKKTVVLMEETSKPLQFEMCVRSMLYEHRYKDRKDFFKCSKATIEKAVKKCKKSLDSMLQSGGSKILEPYMTDIEKAKQDIKKCENEINVQKAVLDDFKKKSKH